MLNNRYITFLEGEVQALKRELKEQRDFYEAKLNDERARRDAEAQIARVREQSLLDRIMVQQGVPQIYRTIDEPATEQEVIPGMLPGQSSIRYYQELEDREWQEAIKQQGQTAQASLLQDLIDEPAAS